MKSLISQVKQCDICLPHLIDGVNPVLSVSEKSKIIIIGQAPGSIVHKTGVPWDDKSGDRLRGWLGVSKEEFYDVNTFAILPMGFCYPGKGKSGDLPPRPECAPKWHNLILEKIVDHKLTLLIGNYAQNYYLKNSKKNNLTNTVQNYIEYLPDYFPLPHPSPRNNIWLKKNEWFEETVIPDLRSRVKTICQV